MRRPLFVVAVFLLVCAASAVSLSKIEGEEPIRIRVLNVSSNMQNEVQRIVDNVSATAMFTVTQVSVPDFDSGTPGSLNQYDVIVFGMNDGGESRGDYSGVYGRTAELKSFVQFGGGIVWTHDTLEYMNDYGVDLEVPAGVDFEEGGPQFGSLISNVRIVRSSSLLHVSFEIGNVGDLIPKTRLPYDQYDHTTGGFCTTATVVIEHADGSEMYNFYLTVSEYGRGRVVVDELGHCMGDSGTDLASTKENQILVNAIYWASRYSHSVGGYLIQISRYEILTIPTFYVVLVSVSMACLVLVRRGKTRRRG